MVIDQPLAALHASPGIGQSLLERGTCDAHREHRHRGVAEGEVGSDPCTVSGPTNIHVRGMRTSSKKLALRQVAHAVLVERPAAADAGQIQRT